MFHHLPPPARGLGHRVASESALRDSGLYCWKCTCALDHVHLHLPTLDRQHVEAEDFWRSTLHGKKGHGRDADLGHLREPSH